ncbi:MAG TPA: ABC transporter C-terminal domain-containing protein, partial [Vicinamibacterales bacterium]|nr:ABC transporter C-terminal domain-containing protein [Vicinamibacterales bacterium]
KDPSGHVKDPSGNAKDPSGNAKDLSGGAKDPSVTHRVKVKTKRTFKEEREYKELPDRIAALEMEQKQIQTALVDSEFYKRPGTEISAAVSRSEQIERELLEAMARWDELDSIGK